MIFVFPHLKFGVEANSIVSPKSYDKAGNDRCSMNNQILENEIGDQFLDRLKQPFDYFPLTIVCMLYKKNAKTQCILILLIRSE